MLKSIRRPHNAFTLIELLVVIVILAVIAVVVMPKFTNRSAQSKESALKTDLKLLRNAIQMCQTDIGVYPTQLSDLTSTTAPKKGVDANGKSVSITSTDWKGPYLQGTVPEDPIAEKAFTYSKGAVTSSASGKGSDGTAYNTW